MSEFNLFTQAYLAAALELCDDASGDVTIWNLPDETKQKAINDCAKFETENHIELTEAYEKFSYSKEQAGTDFWLTRNGHGAGFWDRNLGTIGDDLTEACKAFGETDLYSGDDNLLYFCR